MKLRVLSKQDVQQAVPMREAIKIVKSAFGQLSLGKAVVPLRTQLPVERHEGVTLFMPAYLSESDDLGVKIVSVFPRNLELGLPTIFALVVIVEASTGRPVAVMDGTYLTALRTGAASGAATDLLARQDARVAAIFGAGPQGRTQLLAVCEVRDIDRAELCYYRGSCYHYRGYIYNRSSDYEEAIADYTEAIRLEPYYAEVYLSRARVYRLMGDDERAFADLSDAIRLDPNFGELFADRGSIYYDQGE